MSKEFISESIEGNGSLHQIVRDQEDQCIFPLLEKIISEIPDDDIIDGLNKACSKYAFE